MGRHLHTLAAVATLALLLVAAAARPAYAAYEAYMKIQGATQGAFRGEDTEAGRIPCLQVAVGSEGQRGISTAPGAALGREGRVTIVKMTDSASPKLLKALETHELLTEVDFEFVRTAADGKAAVYKTLRLRDAVVASFRSMPGGAGGRPREQVTLAFDPRKAQGKGGNGTLMPFERWVGIEK